MSRRQLEQILGVIGLLAFIAAQQLLGEIPAVRVAGLICLIAAAFCIFPRALPANKEGSGLGSFLRPTPALLVGLAMLAAGLALLAFPLRAACLLGWSTCP